MRKKKVQESGEETIIAWRAKAKEVEIVDKVQSLLDSETRSAAIRCGFRMLLWLLEQQAAGAEFFVRKDGKEVPVQFVHKFPKL